MGFGCAATGLDQRLWGLASGWKTGDRRVILMGGGESPAEADTDAAVWTLIDEEAARFGGSSMPTYEFECRACQKRFDVVAPITEHAKLKDQPADCPQCGKTDSRQLASLFNCKTASARY